VDGGTGHDDLTLTNSSVSTALIGAFGTGGDTVGVIGGTLHNLTVVGGETSTNLDNTTGGSVKETGTPMTTLNGGGGTFTHRILLAGTSPNSTVTATFSGANTVATAVALSGGASHLSLSGGANLAVTGGVNITASGQASLDLPDANLTAGTVTISGLTGST